MTPDLITMDTILTGLDYLNVIHPELSGINIAQFSVDSRDIDRENALFAAVALKREQIDQRRWYRINNPSATHFFDHHIYIEDAIEAGARVILCERLPTSLLDNVMYIQVLNVIDSLGKLANKIINGRRLSIIGITGSSGKTTTCRAVTAVLNQHGRTNQIYTYRPTPISLPLAILNSINSTTDLLDSLVVELPTDHYGGITALSKICKPDIGVLLNVKDAHLQIFGSLQETTAAKSEILSVLKEEGIGILNWDDPNVKKTRPILGNRKMISFGLTPAADVRGKVVRLEHTRSLYEIAYGDQTLLINVPLIGSSGIYIVLAAVSSGVAVGMDLQEIMSGLEQFSPIKGRMSWSYSDQGRLRIFDNSAKCNTTNLRDMMSAIEGAKWSGSRILILGEFLFHEHPDPEKELWSKICRLFDHIVLFQEEAHTYLDKLENANPSAGTTFHMTNTHEETSKLVVDIAQKSREICYIAITGHEFTNLETTVNQIKQNYED